MKPQEKWKKSFMGIHNARSTEEKFWEKVNIRGEDECWEWQASIDRCGYGKFGSTVAHRIAYQLKNGKIPSKMYVCHICDNPPCVNPKHLFLGTQADNMSDMVKKGRSYDRAGENNPKAKLKKEDVVEIYRLYNSGISGYAIARLYNVTSTTIIYVVRGKSWKDLWNQSVHTR